MAAITFIAIFTFTVFLAGMSWTAGTQESISALVGRWRWLLLGTIWSQLLLLPVMLEITPDEWRWLAFAGVAALALTGAASIKEDAQIHTVAAIIGFTLLTGWVMIMDSVCLLPAFVCIAAGREKWRWRLEVGLIISIYMTIINQLNITL